jgi:hypothetical protein
MSNSKSPQKSPEQQIPRHNLGGAAISAAVRVDAAGGGARWRGRNRSIGAVLDCRCTFSGVEAPGASAR